MIKREDFKNVDHSWVASIDGTLLKIEFHNGIFRLYVYGALAEVPAPEPTVSQPSDKEWKEFLRVANALEAIPRISRRYE